MQYGIRQGRNQNSKSNNLTSEKLCKNVRLTKQQINNYFQLNDLIPELQSLVESGSMKALTL
jgi:ParB family chromosome partitioning protein